MLFLFEWCIIQLRQLFPQIFVELLEAEILAFCQIVEEALFQDAHRILNRRLVLFIGNC